VNALLLIVGIVINIVIKERIFERNQERIFERNQEQIFERNQEQIT
jgi:hypothetical protein